MGNAIFKGTYSYLSLAQSLSVRFQRQLSSFLQDLCRCTLGRFYGHAGPGPQIWKLCFVPNTSHQERKKGMLHPAPRCHMELHNSMGFKCNFRNIDVIQLGLSNFDTTMDPVKILFHESVLHRKVLPGNLNTSVFWEICLPSFSPYCPVMRRSGAVWGKWRRRRERRLRSVVVDTKSPRRSRSPGTKSPRSWVARTKRSHWAASKRCAVAVAACVPFCVPQSLIFFLNFEI